MMKIGETRCKFFSVDVDLPSIHVALRCLSIYTGAGGRQRWSEKDPSKRVCSIRRRFCRKIFLIIITLQLYFGPQNRDQTWDDWGNRSLVVS